MISLCCSLRGVDILLQGRLPERIDSGVPTRLLVLRHLRGTQQAVGLVPLTVKRGIVHLFGRAAFERPGVLPPRLQSAAVELGRGAGFRDLVGNFVSGIDHKAPRNYIRPR